MDTNTAPALVDAAVFLPVVILAVTQLLKMAVPAISGWLTVVVVLVLGVTLAYFDVFIGVSDISIAQGVMSALGAIGINVLADKAGDRIGHNDSPVLHNSTH